MTFGGAQAVGSVTFIDSSIEDTPIGILTGQTSDPSPSSIGSLILENVSFKNVQTAVQGPKNTIMLAGSSGSVNVAGWGRGHLYSPRGPNDFDGDIAPFPRPGKLVRGSKYYERSKPSYADIPASQFLSVRSYGAKGVSVVFANILSIMR
jgi:glucan 1,3-beta-glucosidase